MMIRTLFHLRHQATVVAAVVALSASSLGAQAANPCPAAESARFKFLIGTWNGVVFDLKGADSTRSGTARITTQALFSGCGTLEHWSFKDTTGVPEVDGVVLRGFDAPTVHWYYDLVTNHAEHVVWDGVLDNGTWEFIHDFKTDRGTSRARISWVATPRGYSELIARSTDGGNSWLPTRHINFTRAATGSSPASGRHP